MVAAGAALLSISMVAQSAAPPKPMARDASPAFEVATIKPSNPDETRDGFHSSGPRISADNESVENMIMLAYGVQGSQVVGGPPWIADRRFDINGLADRDGEPSLMQMQGMYQK